MAIRFILVLAAALAALAGPAHAAFPGENGNLVFSAYLLDSEEAGDQELFALEPDGSGLTRLTDNSQVDDVGPAYSPDGRLLAFSRFTHGTTEERLAVMSADGTGVRDLYRAGGVSWSPDGRTLAFSNYTGANFELFRGDVDGTPRVQLTQAGSDEVTPAWSPDGATIAFTSDFNSAQSEIYSMKSDASEDWVPLTSTFGDDASPDWSPDASKIVFVSSRNGNSEVYVMNADGSAETRLTTDPLFDIQPQWSPDGSRIAWVRYDAFSVTAEIWTMNADGTGQAQLTDNTLVETLGDWQPLHNRPPDCGSVTAAPARIDKHNRTFVSTALSGATDPDGDPVSIEVTGVTQDEPVGAAPDARAGAAPDSVRLRAERDNRGDGRVYRIAFEAADGNGGSCTGTAPVGVPRRKNAPAVDSAPPSYDSFGP
jgi:TolB protein